MEFDQILQDPFSRQFVGEFLIHLLFGSDLFLLHYFKSPRNTCSKVDKNGFEFIIYGPQLNFWSTCKPGFRGMRSSLQTYFWIIVLIHFLFYPNQLLLHCRKRSENVQFKSGSKKVHMYDLLIHFSFPSVRLLLHCRKRLAYPFWSTFVSSDLLLFAALEQK